MIKGTYFFVVLAIAFFTVLSTSNLIYKTTYFGWQFTPIFGQVGNNIGIKTMGYYVREHTPEESVVFVDVESFVGEYYVKRKIIGDLDLTDEQIYAQLSSLFNKDSEKGKNVGKNITQEKSPFDYAFIYKEHFATLGPVLERNGYYARVMAVDDHGETIAKLYGLKTKNNSWSPMPIVLSIKETDQLFNKKYGYLNNLYINYG